MKLACFWLRTDGRLLQTGKIDKFIVFCLAQGKSGCVSLGKVGGGGPPGSAAYGIATDSSSKMSYAHYAIVAPSATFQLPFQFQVMVYACNLDRDGVYASWSILPNVLLVYTGNL